MRACLVIVLLTLLIDPFDDDATRTGVPPSTVGRDVVGKSIPLDTLTWLNTAEKKPLPVKGKVTLVRWWTDSCPYCVRSLPAIQGLQEEYEKQGFQTVAVYHPKPPPSVGQSKILQWAKEREFKGPVALDREWKTLRGFYLDRRRPATSVSFLIGRKGKVRYVHPGPVLAPAAKPEEKRLDDEYAEMKRAIEALLRE